jgi:hypothetical protein
MDYDDNEYASSSPLLLTLNNNEIPFTINHIRAYLLQHAPWLDLIGILRILRTFQNNNNKTNNNRRIAYQAGMKLDVTKTYMLESGGVCEILDEQIDDAVINILLPGTIFGLHHQPQHIIVMKPSIIWESNTTLFLKAALLAPLQSKCLHTFVRVVEQAFFIDLPNPGNVLQEIFMEKLTSLSSTSSSNVNTMSKTDDDVNITAMNNATSNSFVVLQAGSAVCGGHLLTVGEVCPFTSFTSTNNNNNVTTKTTTTNTSTTTTTSQPIISIKPHTRFLIAQHVTIENFTSSQYNEFIHIQTIGAGDFGTIELVQRIDSSTGHSRTFALKKVQNVHDPIQVKSIERELDALLAARGSPFIIRLLGAIYSAPPMLLLEYLPGGNLLYVLENLGQKLTGNDHRFYLLSIALALAHLHSCCIIYRDLKPENVVIDHRGNLRLIDFGLSKRLQSLEELTWTLCGTPDYLSPELISGKGTSFPNDWWAFGILAFELATGFTPFSAFGSTSESHQPGELDPGLCRRILNDPVYLPEDWDDHELINFVLTLLDKNPMTRPKSEWVLTHAVFNGIDLDLLCEGKILPPYLPMM